MTYHAYARRDDGKIGQLLVTKEKGRPSSQAWTGKTYKNERAARDDCAALNAKLSQG